MKIKLNSIFVDDQRKALAFYTDVLGFVKSKEIPLGENLWWLTVVSPEAPDEVELVLEPNSNLAAKTYQEALLAQGIPITAFETEDVDADFARLKQHGVAFTTEPTDMGPVRIAVFADTCGNLIQLYQLLA